MHGTNKFIELRKKQMAAKQAEDRNTHEVQETGKNNVDTRETKET